MLVQLADLKKCLCSFYSDLARSTCIHAFPSHTYQVFLDVRPHHLVTWSIFMLLQAPLSSHAASNMLQHQLEWLQSGWEGITSLVQQEKSASSSKRILLKQALGRQKYNLLACSSCLRHAKSEWYKVCILTIAKSQASLACGGGGSLHQIFPPI